MEPLLFKGEIIQCPECKLDLYKVRGDTLDGEIMDASQFDPIGIVLTPVNGTPALCPECGAGWARGYRVCTSVSLKGKGWVDL